MTRRLGIVLPPSLFVFLFLLCPALPGQVEPSAGPDADRATDVAAIAPDEPHGDYSDDRSRAIGIVMLVLLFTAFFAMTRYNAPLPLAMSLVACVFLGLQGARATHILRTGFEHYSDIVILFTAVAIPAHMIERSQGFKWAAAYFGYQFGRVRLTRPRMATPLLILSIMAVTYVTAGLMHNVTSILIMTPIIIRLCDSYGIPSRWILCGALVASNLGGFSTRWGDTPNIIEAATWGLSAGDFMVEVVPANLIVLVTMSLAVTFLTLRRPSGSGTLTPTQMRGPLTIDIAKGAAGWQEAQASLQVDSRLLCSGIATLVAFIVLHVVFDEYKIAIGALTIFVAVLLDRSSERFETLKSLGFDVYLAFAAIFVLAGCFKESWVGYILQEQIRSTEAAPWAIAVTGYFGTMFTEAASWATAASEQIYALGGPPHNIERATSHAAAWALGGGICAGSSSLITAASAGIILAEESSRFKDDRHVITFRRYLPFGLAFSAFMLLFYAVYFTIAG